MLCTKICLHQKDKGSDSGAQHGGKPSGEVFAKYIRHIQRTGVYAKVDLTGEEEHVTSITCDDCNDSHQGPSHLPTQTPAVGLIGGNQEHVVSPGI